MQEDRFILPPFLAKAAGLGLRFRVIGQFLGDGADWGLL